MLKDRDSENLNKVKKINSRSNIKKNKENRIKADEKIDKSFIWSLKEIFPILPLMVLVSFLPFIIRLKLIPLQGDFYKYWNGQTTSTDFFTYYKQIFIYIITLWSLLHTFFFTKRIKRTKAYYFMGAYAILVIFSALFSEFPSISLHGFVERREGTWIILSYIAIMFSVINLVKTEKQVKILIYAFGISGSLISLIAIFQYAGKDIFASEKMKSVIIPSAILSRVKEFNIALGEKYAYSVFYNPNYLGGYLSFYSPLMLGMAIFMKKKAEKLIFSFLFVLSVLALYSGRSEAGVFGFSVAFLLIVLTFLIKRIFSNMVDTNKDINSKDKVINHNIHKENDNKENTNKGIFSQKNKKKLIVISLSAVLIALPILLSYAPIDQNPLGRIRNEAFEILKPSVKDIDYKANGPINDIKRIDDQTIGLKINNKSIKLAVKESQIIIKSEDDSIIYENNVLQLPDRESIFLDKLIDYETYIMIYKTAKDEIYGIHLYLPSLGGLFHFMAENDELFLTDSLFKKLDIEKDFAVAPHIGFEGKGNLGSGRGYIWSRSIPLALDNIIIGTGQDTFITQFPQYDIYGKQAETNLYSLWTITDKPHSMYLQIAIQSGLLSLIILLAGFALLTYKSFKLSVYADNMAFIINASLIGFMVSSVFNDSIIAITPIVYVLLGLNVVCILNKKSEKAVE